MLVEQRRQKWVNRAIKIHGNKYNYSKITYKNLATNVNIWCNMHKKFFSCTPGRHIHKNHPSGCPDCGREQSSRKRTTLPITFFNKCKEKHGNKFDYSNANFTKLHEIVYNILCNTCKKTFNQIAHNHLGKGYGCIHCSKGNKVTNLQEFIEKSSKLHNNFYTYGNSEYKNSTTKLKINCSLHGIFEQTPSLHLAGYGCSKCGIERMISLQTYTTKEITEKFIEIHGTEKYGYDKVVHTNVHEKVDIFCYKCNEYFSQSPGSHLQGHGCNKCAINVRRLKQRIPLENVIARARKVHQDIYDYKEATLMYTSDKKKYINNILCKIHGSFSVLSQSHLVGQGCPKCKKPKLELEISSVLIELKIANEIQVKYDDCKNVKHLPYDFCIFDNEKEIRLEGQGRGHFNYDIYYYNNIIQFTTRLNTDNKKSYSALKAGHSFLSISYLCLGKIELVISQFLEDLQNYEILLRYYITPTFYVDYGKVGDLVIKNTDPIDDMTDSMLLIYSIFMHNIESLENPIQLTDADFEKCCGKLYLKKYIEKHKEIVSDHIEEESEDQEENIETDSNIDFSDSDE